MSEDDFDLFVYRDSIERRGLDKHNAWLSVEHYRSWIRCALVRLAYSADDAERRAADSENEQDIRLAEMRVGWSGQLLAAYQAQRDKINEGLRMKPVLVVSADKAVEAQTLTTSVARAN